MANSYKLINQINYKQKFSNLVINNSIINHMKKILKLLTGLALSVILFTGCEDDEESQKNYFYVGENEFIISGGLLVNWGIDDSELWHEGYNTDLSLYTEGLTVEEVDGEHYFEGNGRILYFEMFSESGSSLDETTYTFSEEIPYSKGTFDYGEYVYNYDSEDDEPESFSEITDGTVTISKVGSDYIISIECVTNNDETIKGYYKGRLEYIEVEWTWQESSRSKSELKPYQLTKK